jgi:hypothetical protein
LLAEEYKAWRIPVNGIFFIVHFIYKVHWGDGPSALSRTSKIRPHFNTSVFPGQGEWLPAIRLAPG